MTMKAPPPSILLAPLALAALFGCPPGVANIGYTVDTTASSTTTTSASDGGAMLCSPGATRPCADAGTACVQGVEVCQVDGSAWSSCTGAVACEGKVLWAERFGDAEDQSAQSVAIGPNGQVIFAGAVAGTIDLSGVLQASGGGDALVGALGSDGVPAWGRLYGDADAQAANAVAATDAGAVAVIGNFASKIDLGTGTLTSAGGADVFVALIEGGHATWARSWGSAHDDDGNAIAIDAAGDVIVAGAFHDTIDLGTGTLVAPGVNRAPFVAKLARSDGHTIWARTSGGGGFAHALSVGPDGAVFVGGGSFGALNFGGGTVPGTAPGCSCAYVVKLNAGGSVAWGKAFVANNGSDIGALATAGDGSVMATGMHIGQADFGGGPVDSSLYGNAYVVKLDANGGYQWAKSFGEGVGVGLSITAAGHVVTAGYFTGPADFGGGTVQPDPSGSMFVAKLGSDGGYLWAHAYATAFQEPLAVVASGEDTVLVGGFAGSILGLTSAGGFDIFAARFGP
jgi:hypothetical protein